MPTRTSYIETLESIYAAINRNDIPAMLDSMDADIEWIEPSGYPGSGTHRGHEAVMANAAKGRDTWAEGACHLERFVMAGDKIVVFVRALVRLKDHTEWIDGRFADVYTFRDGKVIQMRSFADRHEALEWAGATAADVLQGISP